MTVYVVILSAGDGFWFLGGYDLLSGFIYCLIRDVGCMLLLLYCAIVLFDFTSFCGYYYFGLFIFCVVFGFGVGFVCGCGLVVIMPGFAVCSSLLGCLRFRLAVSLSL